jgi:putative transposase
MRYQAMRDNEERVPVRLICRALAVSPAGHYAWAARPENRRTAANWRLVTMICAIHTESRNA